MKIEYKKLHPEAKTPVIAHDTDAGLDLYATEALSLKPGERGQASTGIALAIPAGYVGLIWDKSGVSHKRGIKTLGGVIDAGYRGEVFVGLINLSDEEQAFAAGDKVAQMLIQKIEQPDLQEVDELDETSRGTGAFGSTGK